MIGYICAGCEHPFCWGCDRTLDTDHELKEPPVPRYCDGCADAEADANGLTAETVRAVRARRKREPCDHTRGWTLKVRSNPGSPIAANYECPAHGVFTATVPRDASGDPPAEIPCPELEDVLPMSGNRCGLTSPWRPTAPLGKVKLGQVVQGKVGEYPPDHMCLDTRELGDGMPKHEWRAKQEKITRDATHRKWRERDGGPRKVHFT